MLSLTLLGFLLIPSDTGQTPALEIVAHRGASFDAPENTLASVRLGWEQGADAVEIDVFLSKDGRLVVLHDKDTSRVAGLDRPVVDQTADELRRLDVGSWKDPRFAGERIPLLEEVLATVPTGKRLFVEVKCGPEAVPALKQAVESSGLAPAQVAIISFHPEVIAASKQALPDLKAYWVVGIRQDKNTGAWSPTLEALLAKSAEIHADGLDLSAREVVDAEWGRRIHEAGLDFAVWTVNDPDLARRMIAAGARSITTDRPGWLREQLSQKP